MVLDAGGVSSRVLMGGEDGHGTVVEGADVNACAPMALAAEGGGLARGGVGWVGGIF